MVGTKKTILIIEDSADARDTLALMLSLEQYVVRVVSSRDEAVEVLSHGEPDVVLLDWFMPGMSIEDFVSKARKMYPSIQIVLVSASLNTEKKAQEWKLNFILKPYDPAELLKVIDLSIQKRRRLDFPY
ncbi:MAG TPA: response regulator [Planctomycetota bacterium]|nr:response regulator [Planctomycetota bacterium]